MKATTGFLAWQVVALEVFRDFILSWFLTKKNSLIGCFLQIVQIEKLRFKVR
jgi:hypothetical protein